MADNKREPNQKRLLDLELEPIDAAELNLQDFPEVQPASRAPRKIGFGFGKAVLWCLLFLLVGQGIPAFLFIAGLTLAVLAGWVTLPRAADESAANSLGIDLAASEMQTAFQVILGLSQFFSIGFSLLVLRYAVGKDWSRKIGLRLPHFEHVLLVMIAFPAAEVLITILEETLVQFIPGLFDMEGFVKGMSSWPAWLGVLLIGVGPGIGEELWCRGFLNRGLSARYGFPVSLVMTSFLFGAIHLHPLQATLAMLMGGLLHATYLATRSLWVPIGLHMLHNSLVLLNETKSWNVPFHASLKVARELQPFLFPLLALLLTIIAGICLYASRVQVHWPASSRPSKVTELIPDDPDASLLPTPLQPGLFVLLIVAAGLFGYFWAFS